MKQWRELRIINVLGFAFLLVASFIFSRGGALNTQEIRPLFSPAAYAFRIWGLIYLLVGIWVAAQFIDNGESQKIYESIGYWFATATVLSGLTILVPLNLSPFFIVGSLIALIVIYERITKSIPGSSLIRIPFSFYIGWISVATIANISLVLKNLGFTEIFGLGELAWTLILLVIGTLLALVFMYKHNDVIYPLVFIWGYIAIGIENKGIRQISVAVIILCEVILLNIIYVLYKRWNGGETSKNLL